MFSYPSHLPPPNGTALMQSVGFNYETEEEKQNRRRKQCIVKNNS
jgi:hypothetical protein